MFDLLVSTIFFFFGASIGSFVQVVATRLNVAPIARTRSKCLSCGEALRFSDLVPVLSYIFLQGKCRYCKSTYGISSLVVEVLYGCVFMALYYFILQGQVSLLIAGLWLLYYTGLFTILGVIALYDKAHTYIPLYYLVLYLLFTLGAWVVQYSHDHSFYTLSAPFVVALPFFSIWLISKGRALGLGDVVLLFGVGAFFGIAQGLAVFLLSVWLGAIVGVVLYLVKKQKPKVLPFVPFIVIAFLIVLFADIDIFSIATLFA